MWAFEDFLPRLNPKFSLQEGCTPIMKIKNMDRLKGLHLKLENRNPNGTFRDRGSSLIVSHAIMGNFENIISVSTGSYAISLSSYCAAANIHSINILPENTELSKIEQLRVFGSEIIQHGETLDQAKLYANQYLNRGNIYSPQPRENIFTIEGQKTIGLEIIHQLDSKIDSVIIPKGSGTLILSIYRGFQDALKSHWIEEIPRIISVSLDEQAERSYLIEALEISKKDTLLLDEVSKIIKSTDGIELKISPIDMINDALQLAKYEGHFIEPASASVISASKHLISKNEINPDTSIAILTGSGLNALNVFASQMRDMKKVVWGLSTTSTRKFEILNLIAENKATNGSQIWNAMGKNKTRQSVYQHLSELESKGLISAEMKTKKSKKYHLTRKGFEALDKMRGLIDLL